MRISASLISAEDGATLWSHNFDTHWMIFLIFKMN